jgi:transposase
MAMNDLNQSDQNQSGAAPDPEVRSKPERRRFTADYKRRILKEVAACKDPGQIGALLRREGLYSSNLTKWRRQMASGDPNAFEPRKRGPKTDPLAIENAALKKRNQKLEEELKRAKIVIDVQKNSATCWGCRRRQSWRRNESYAGR